MRVVIPVRNEPRNLSLPYALASIRQHTGLDPLTVGAKDFGLSDHLNISEPGSNKRSNSDRAMLAAIDHLGEPFVWQDDDVYWLAPAAPIRWALGDLADNLPATYAGKRKRATLGFLQAHGLPTYDYESHTPLPIFDLTAAREALKWCADFPLLDKRSVYGNLTGVPDRIAPDVKLRNPSNRHRDVEWASTEGDPARYPHLIGRLAVLGEYPEQTEDDQ